MKPGRSFNGTRGADGDSARLGDMSGGKRRVTRALELPAKPFHLATLFQPQLSSSFATPHPIVEGLLRACCG